MSTLTKTNRTITVTHTLREDDLKDVLTTACEGGIGYWFRGLEYVWNAPEAFIAGYITDEVEDDDALGDEWTDTDAFVEAVKGNSLDSTTLIDHDVIAAGVALILSGQVGIRDDLMAQVMTLVGDEDSVDVDSDAADCIVQAGVFGEVVYG